MSRSNLGWRLVALLISAVVTALLGMAINYFTLPAMTSQSAGFWWFCIVLLIVAAVAYFIANAVINNITCEEGGYPLGIAMIVVIVLVFVIFIGTAVFGSEMVKAKQYANIIDIETGDFKEDIAEINLDEIAVVDVKTARVLGGQMTAKVENASWYEVDKEYNLVMINGEAYRISPLNYGSVWKTFKADDYGIPGYVLVDAKTQKAEYVEFEDTMRYSPSAIFGYDLTRHLRNLYPSYIFGKSFFEVDDEGSPYWITSVKTPQVGERGGKVTTSVLITDAVNGKTKEYALDEIPEWVDHVDSVGDLVSLIEWYYGYWDGFWNSFTSKTKVYHTTYYYRNSKQSESQNSNRNDLAANEFTPFEGYNSIITEDGEVMFYTGITPANNAETNIGFVLINPRTHEVTFYEAIGAEESSAQIAVEGLVSDLRYSASFPTVVNVDGVETYFMVLKDGAGLIQRYAFTNVEDYTKCVQAETKEEALRLYKIEIGLIEDDRESEQTSSGQNQFQNQENTNPNPDVETVELHGLVTNVEEAQINGYTYYYFTIEGYDNIVFMSSIENSNYQPLKLQVGNQVTIQYYESTKETGIGIVTAIEFVE